MEERVAKQRVYFLRRPQVWLSIVVLALLYSGLWSVASAPPVNHRRHISIIKKYPKPDCRRVACIALTFDDGPNAATTSRILDTLEKERVPATFFVLGSRVAAHAKLVQRMHKSGMEVGNHSWSHPDMTRLKPRQIRAQVTSTQVAIEKAGAPAPTLFRPPYGEVNGSMKRNIPLTFMFWNEDPRDWNARKPAQVANAVIKSAHPGGVVDLHDIYPATAAALPKIVHDLRARRYHFVTASQLLDLRPGQKGYFYGWQPPY